MSNEYRIQNCKVCAEPYQPMHPISTRGVCLGCVEKLIDVAIQEREDEAPAAAPGTESGGDGK